MSSNVQRGKLRDTLPSITIRSAFSDTWWHAVAELRPLEKPKRIRVNVGKIQLRSGKDSRRGSAHSRHLPSMMEEPRTQGKFRENVSSFVTDKQESSY